MNKYKIFLCSLIICLVCFVWGAGLISHSASLNEYMEGNLYIFEFGLSTQDFDDDNGTNKIHIQDFSFYYDFTEDKGRISFDLGQGNWSLGYISIRFPSVIQNKTLDVYSIKNGANTNIDNSYFKIREVYIETSRTRYTTLHINNPDRTFNNETFVVEFNSDLKPSGSFSFVNNANDNINPNNEQGNVNFVLGDDYECIGNCVYNLKYMEEMSESSNKNIKLNFNDGENDQTRLFKLNAVNRDTRFWKPLLMGFGISFIFASLSSIFVLLYDDATNNNSINLRVTFNKAKNWIGIQIRRIKK